MEEIKKESEVKEVTEKTFTQEQVNEIIRKRLKDQKDIDEQTKELDSRTAELTARENRLSCREYLIENGYPLELLDVIDSSDVETFKERAEKSVSIFSANQEPAPLASSEPALRETAAFPDTTHVPKGYWPTDPR